MNSVFGLLLFGCLIYVQCVPFHEGHVHPVDSGFIGKGTNELATAFLQGFVGKEDNQVYSPFGYSAILAVFAEGARGISREEIAKALYFPENVNQVREAYRSVLERFVGKKFTNAPEFKNWFYIYKNYTVEEDLQNVLRKYYLTEVKTVDRPEDLIKDTKKSPIKDVVDPDKKIEMEMQKLEKAEADKMMMTDDTKMNTNSNMKAVDHFEKEMPKSLMSRSEQMTENENKPMEEVKAEKEAPTKQNAEVMNKNEMSEEVISAMGEKKKTEEMMPAMGENKKTLEMMPAVGENKKTVEMMPAMEENKKAEEMMHAMEEKPKSEAMMKSEKENTEMENNSIEDFSGMTDNTMKICGPDSKPRLVIFNGLYYRGEWESPFVKMRADDSRVFYKSEKEKIVTSTLHSQGVFNYGNIPSLDCRAIELPYKGGRYSLVILVPNARDGLTKLISDLSGFSFKSVYDQLTEKLVDVCLPSFEINTISKPISTLNKLGLTNVKSIFSPEKADLSGISPKNSGLYVEELVQMVTFKVDAEYSKTNFLTASIASSRSNVQKFQINQPFLFYLRDNVEDIIIANGKVIDPTPKSHFYFS